MASNGVHQFHQQQQQQSPHHCKECGLYLNSAESLDVHLQYHKENLLNKWATQAATSHEETNNNTTKNPVKREFPSNSVAAADSSDALMKKSPEYGSRATPDTSGNFGHPPTPQSYHSASSPYQNPPDSGFSPNFPGYQVKQERASPGFQQGYPPYEGQFFMEGQGQFQQQDFMVHKMASSTQNFRYQPYGYERGQVSSSSPAYPAQPTPSPSPKQCDKCGFVCDSASQLIEHLNVAHPPTPYQGNQFMFTPQEVKTEEGDQSEILDLDSHKVHQVYPEDEKRNGDLNGHNPHSVSAMLNPWPQQQKMYGYMPDTKMYQNGMGMAQQPVHSPDYMTNSVSTTSQEMPQLPYRPFEHLPQSSTPVITSTQVPTPAVANTSPVTKSANWKSNEARRPKTYNCTACNKWFTSSGHLKRHYNTTLHKNAVKSSGQPDPATMPISAHHHPARESSASREDRGSSSPSEESRGEDSLPSNFDRPGPIPGLIQQPPNGPYDRQPLHHPPLHSPMGPNPLHLSATSPPNGEAGPSVSTAMDSRGLLSITQTTPTHGFNMAPMMGPMDSPQFQMYPNESAPHVTQDTAITNSPNTTGELLFVQDGPSLQPLPSFSAIHGGQRYGVIVGCEGANVGGLGPATAPFTYYQNQDGFDVEEEKYLLREEEDYKLTVMTPAEPRQEDPLAPTFDSLSEEEKQRTTPSNLANQPNAQNTPMHPNVKREPGATPTHHASVNHPSQNGSYQMVIFQGNHQIMQGDQRGGTSIRTLTPIFINENQTSFSQNFSPQNNNSIYSKFPEDKPYKMPPSYNNNSTLHNNNLTTQGVTQGEEDDSLSPKKPKKRDFEQGITSPSVTSTTAAAIQLKQQGIHKCFDCDKVFNKSCYLTQHNKTFHSGDKPFKCGRCGKRFSCENQYKEHHSKHAGEKPHKCELCPKQFNHKTDLRRHMCLHTGQKPYACEACGKGFIRKDHMLKHVETHTRRPHSKMRAVR